MDNFEIRIIEFRYILGDHFPTTQRIQEIRSHIETAINDMQEMLEITVHIERMQAQKTIMMN